MTPGDPLVQLPFAMYNLLPVLFLPAQTKESCALFEQRWRGGLNSPLSVNIGRAISERPGTHNNLPCEWPMELPDKGHLIHLNGYTPLLGGTHIPRMSGSNLTAF